MQTVPLGDSLQQLLNTILGKNKKSIINLSVEFAFKTSIDFFFHSISPLKHMLYAFVRNDYPKYVCIINLVLLNPDIPCFCKQCRSRSVGF